MWLRPWTGWPIRRTASVALSAFAGVLSKGGTRALDDVTVEFRLDAPNGSFPYLVSSDNYNAIILPAEYAGGFEKNFIGTGPFRLERFTPKARASFVRNDDYWGAKALPGRLLFSFYESIQAQVLAMQGGQLDVLLHVPVQGSQALLADPRFNILALKSSAHEQVHLRTDRGPFADKRVRRAIALCLNRENLVAGMFRGRGGARQRQPVRADLCGDRPHGSAAHAGSRPSQGTTGRRRRAQRLQGHADHGALPGAAGLCRGDPKRGPQDRRGPHAQCRGSIGLLWPRDLRPVRLAGFGDGDRGLRPSRRAQHRP